MFRPRVDPDNGVLDEPTHEVGLSRRMGMQVGGVCTAHDGAVGDGPVADAELPGRAVVVSEIHAVSVELMSEQL